MKTGYLITARMKSTRLPRKLCLEINNRQIIRWMIDRVKLAKNIDEIVICTSTNEQDDVLEQIAKEENVKVFRGHEDDVIQRLYEASKTFNLDYALNITADCPLVSFEYIDAIVEKYKETDADFIRTLDLPHGFFSYGLKVDAIKKVVEIKDDLETEVWGRYFTDTGLFSVIDMEIPKEYIRPQYRLTLDYPEDFAFFEAVFSHFKDETYKTSMEDIITFLDNNPTIVKINESLAMAWKERWEKQNKLDLK